MAETIDLLEVKAAARKVLEEVFPADDEAALIAAVTPDFVNHEARPRRRGRPVRIFYMHALASAFTDQRWTVIRVMPRATSLSCTAPTAAGISGRSSASPRPGEQFAYRQMHMIRCWAAKVPNTGRSATTRR